MQQESEMLNGTVEADETYIGGKRINAKKFENKTPVLGAIEKGGTARAKVSDLVSMPRAKAFLRENVEQG